MKILCQLKIENWLRLKSIMKNTLPFPNLLQEVVTKPSKSGNSKKVWGKSHFSFTYLLSGHENKFVVVADLKGEHGDWVRDVAWSPSIGAPYETLVSCSEV